MIKNKAYLLLFFLLVCSLFETPVFATSPTPYLTETVTGSYNVDGTISVDIDWQGYVDVVVPNTVDVLQYIRINLSDALDETDINTNTSVRNVAASPGAGDKTRIKVNATDDGDDTNWDNAYNISNITAAPSLALHFWTYNNQQGGSNMYSEDNVGSGGINNTFDFIINITNPSADKNLDGDDVYVRISFAKTAAQDAVNILTTGLSSYGTGTSQTSIAVSDSDADGDNDTLIWVGNINAGSELAIDFDADVQGNFHYTTTSNNLNGLDGGTSLGARTSWNITTQVLTSNSIANLFTRGPVLQGVDFAPNPSTGNWQIRGFVENAADTGSNDLIYNVTNWTIYEINASNGAPFDDYNLTYTSSGDWNSSLEPSDSRIYTDWFNTATSSGKPYFSVAFDWQVDWASPVYYGEINTTLVFPTLYEIDITPEKPAPSGVLLPETANNALLITDKATHNGDDSLDVGEIELLSKVPYEDDVGSNERLFDINNSYDIKIYYHNSTHDLLLNSTNETGVINISITDPSSGTFGVLNVTIHDLSRVNCIDFSGDNLGSNLSNGGEDFINVTFQVLSSNNILTGENFTFWGQTKFITTGGTPITEAQPNQTVTASEKRLLAYKQVWIDDSSDETLVNVTINISVIDKSAAQGGISGIKWIDFIPAGTDFNFTNVTVSFNDESGSGWSIWSNGTEFLAYNNGSITLSDGIQVTGYEYTYEGGTWDGVMYDGDQFNISYQVRINSEGDYVMPMQLAGFDPKTGESFGSNAFGFIKITLSPPLLEPVITDSEFQVSQFVTVGKPVEWFKNFEVYNPNLAPVEPIFETEIFNDALNYRVTYVNDFGEEIVENAEIIGKTLVWSSRIGAQESRVYTLKVFTPPVLETGRDVEVLEKISDNLIELKVKVSLRNFAEEDYENVRFNLPIKSSQVISVTNEFGEILDFSGKTLSVLIPEFPANSLKEVGVLFKESYPLVIIKTDKGEYASNDEVMLTITVINGAEDVKHPFIETEVYSEGMDLVHSNILDLRALNPAETTEIEDTFQISTFMPTGAYVAGARFRGGIGSVISVGKTGFSVAGVEPIVSRNVTLIFIVLLGGLMIYYVIRRGKLK